jgi:hypothetical protein
VTALGTAAVVLSEIQAAELDEVIDGAASTGGGPVPVYHWNLYVWPWAIITGLVTFLVLIGITGLIRRRRPAST